MRVFVCVCVTCSLFLGGCRDTGAGSDPDSAVPSPDAAVWDGALPDAAPPDAWDPPPEPEPLEPCANGTCWETRVPALGCTRFDLGEDFSSGNYNVHRYATTIWGGVQTRLEAVRTGGTYQPAIVVVAEDGTVLYDGVVGRVEPGLTVTPELDGTTGDTTRVSVASDETVSVHVFVTGWTVVQSDFVAFLPTNVTYDLAIEGICDGMVTEPCVVNGHPVAEPACTWLHYLAREVVPRLEGTRVERVNDAAVVGWWALKEGVVFLSNPLVYSNCNFPTGDEHIGALESCVPGRAWQVGISGVQVPGKTLAALSAAATTLYASETVDEVLDKTARAAGLMGSEVTSVVGSTGDLRISWLLRNAAIGVTFQVGPVTSECIDDSLSWCYGTGWTSTALYAPDRTSALGSIEDIRLLLDSVAP